MKNLLVLWSSYEPKYQRWKGRGVVLVFNLFRHNIPNVTNGHQHLRVGDEVFLKSILNSTETVARGRVQSLVSNDLVGGTEIGPKWCEVNVQVPIKKMKTW
ncbi:putative transposase, Tnp1/En/Spm [Helianthus debilis subsp. tardiflorus]